jgi:hypothetical protein
LLLSSSRFFYSLKHTPHRSWLGMSRTSRTQISCWMVCAITRYTLTKWYVTTNSESHCLPNGERGCRRAGQAQALSEDEPISAILMHSLSEQIYGFTLQHLSLTVAFKFNITGSPRNVLRMYNHHAHILLQRLSDSYTRVSVACCVATFNLFN